MYSKDLLSGKFSPPLAADRPQPPDNYSGTALYEPLPAIREAEAPPDPDIPAAAADASCPPCGAAADCPSSSHCPLSSALPSRDSPSAAPPPSATADAPPRGLLASLFPPGLSGLTSRGEFGFEELLLVGLIFLLSQSDGTHDILLMLALLLFFK